MKKIIFGLAALLCLPVITSSCSDSDDVDYVTKQTIAPTFAYMTAQDGYTTTFNNVSYLIYLNYTKGTADIDISGLGSSASVMFSTLKMKNIKMTVGENDLKHIHGTNITPETTNGIPGTTFMTFDMWIKDRIIGSSYAPLFYVDFTTLDGRHYTGSVNIQAYIGSATSTDADGQAYNSKNVTTLIQPDFTTNKLTFSLNDLYLTGGMQEYDLVIKELNCTYTGNGEVKGELAGPVVIDVTGPQSKITVSNVQIKYNYMGDVTASFDVLEVDKTYKISFSGNINNTKDE